MKVLKAGTILVDEGSKMIGLIFREKGHLEKGESLIECAKRETAEETKRDCQIIGENPVYEIEYFDGVGDYCKVAFYLAYDAGRSDNQVGIRTSFAGWILTKLKVCCRIKTLKICGSKLKTLF